jgi:hypothetical protein
MNSPLPRLLRILLVFTTISLILIPLSQLHAQDNLPFIPSLGDVPLMKGLTLVEDSETVLDLPEGRIVEIFATGTLSQHTISQFYLKTLPALGWNTSTSDDSFSRDNETLSISYFPGENLNTVRFALSPQNPS